MGFDGVLTKVGNEKAFHRAANIAGEVQSHVVAVSGQKYWLFGAAASEKLQTSIFVTYLKPNACQTRIYTIYALVCFRHVSTFATKKRRYLRMHTYYDGFQKQT